MMEDGSNREALEWLKREVSDAAGYAHKAMWFAAIAAICGVLVLLRSIGLL